MSADPRAAAFHEGIAEALPEAFAEPFAERFSPATAIATWEQLLAAARRAPIKDAARFVAHVRQDIDRDFPQDVPRERRRR